MDKKQLTSIIKVLEAVREKPLMFVGTDLSGISHFLNGFRAACGALGINSAYEKIYEEILLAHEWRPSPSLVYEMKERGLDDIAIATELVTLSVETWQRLYSAETEQTVDEQKTR
jgi:hypothetical protein